jgi:hypothetical protein
MTHPTVHVSCMPSLPGRPPDARFLTRPQLLTRLSSLPMERDILSRDASTAHRDQWIGRTANGQERHGARGVTVMPAMQMMVSQ